MECQEYLEEWMDADQRDQLEDILDIAETEWSRQSEVIER